MIKKIKNKVIVSSILLIFLFLSSVVNAFFIRHDISNDDNKYELLIISPEKFNSGLQLLVTYKIDRGIATKLVNLNHIYEEILEGRDDAEKIKYFIKKAKEEWNISYVLLVGGRKKQFSLSEEWWVPVRYVHIEDRWSVLPEYNEKFISDLYFADIYDSEGNFSSWDTDGNGIYGEWLDNKSADDILDLYPEVYIGRLPCRNNFEVKIMVKKIIDYEKEKCADSWFRNMVVVAGDALPDNDVCDGEAETQWALEQMPNFDHTRLWASWGTLTSTRDIIREINKGCGFLYFCGHGSPISWSTFPVKTNDTRIGISVFHIPFLLNGKKLPICITDGCHNSMFNISISHSSHTQGIPAFECLSWRLTRKIGGGSIATIGNTGLSHSAVSKIDPSKGGGFEQLVIYFFGEYSQNGTNILGELWGKAIDAYLQSFPINWNENSYNDTALDAKIVEEWLLIGDPSLKIGGYS